MYGTKVPLYGTYLDGLQQIDAREYCERELEGYTRKEIKRAREARRIQGMIANPTEREFSAMVREKLLANCPITVQDVNNAHYIHGRDLANIRGKMTRRKPEHVQVDYVQIPRDFVNMHKYVTLAADVMFMNGLPFLVTLSRGISLVMIEYLPSRMAKHLDTPSEEYLGSTELVDM